MSMMEVFYLLNLIINIIKLVLDICDKKESNRPASQRAITF